MSILGFLTVALYHLLLLEVPSGGHGHGLALVGWLQLGWFGWAELSHPSSLSLICLVYVCPQEGPAAGIQGKAFLQGSCQGVEDSLPGAPWSR